MDSDPSENAAFTGIVFNHNFPPTETNLLTVTLGTGSTTFNYSDFNLYVLYDNTSFYGNPTGDSNRIDVSISVAAGAGATGASAFVLPVTDPAIKIPDHARVP